MDYDPFRPIYGAKAISEYLDISIRGFHEYYRDEMYAYGCIWKQNGAKTSQWVTMPLLLAVFFLARNLHRADA